MKLTVIGDVHGKTKTYQKIVRRLPEGQPRWNTVKYLSETPFVRF